MTIWIDQVAYAKKEILQLDLNTDLEPYIAEIIGFLQEWWSDDDFITASTSGSTGKPKIILLSKERMKISARATGVFFDFPQTICSPLSARFIAGKMMLVRALEWEADIICNRPQHNPLSDLDRKVDFMVMTPHQLLHSLSSENNKKLELVDALLLGGSPVNNTLRSKTQDLSTKIFLGYGMTETMSHVALQSINGPYKTDYYQAVKGITFTTDHRNCLIIHTDKLLAEPLITNDVVACIDRDKFTWISRYDEVVNSGGIKLFPRQIEQKIEELIENPYYLIGVPDKTLGERLVLYVESKSKDIDKQRLLTKIKALVEPYERPREIIIVSSFSYTESGKVKRKRI